MIYCDALLPNAGLGNRLFPWARAVLLSKKYNIRMLEPVWPQIKPGAILRRERDLRTYHDLFKRHPDHGGAFERAWVWCTAQKISEGKCEDILIRKTGSQNYLVVCQGPADHFAQLSGCETVLYEELRTITRETWLKEADKFSDIPIGIHIRRGDVGSQYSPLCWFVETLVAIRKIIRKPVLAYVVSDEKSDQFEDLFRLEGVLRIDTRSAIGDLLALSRSKILVASPSTFSAWASYFGQMPTVTSPGHDLRWWQLPSDNGQYIGEFDSGCPPPQFAEQIRSLFDKSEL